MMAVKSIALTIEFADIDDMVSTEYEPSEVLQRKIEALAEMLNCTEEEAERAFFDRL